MPMDEIVCGNRAPLVPDNAIEALDTRGRRLYAYYEKLNDKKVA